MRCELKGLLAGSQTSTDFLFPSFSFILLLLTLVANRWLNAAELLPPRQTDLPDDLLWRLGN